VYRKKFYDCTVSPLVHFIISGGISGAYLEQMLNKCCWKRKTTITLFTKMAHFLCERAKIAAVNLLCRWSKWTVFCSGSCLQFCRQLLRNWSENVIEPDGAVWSFMDILHWGSVV